MLFSPPVCLKEAYKKGVTGTPGPPNYSHRDLLVGTKLIYSFLVGGAPRGVVFISDLLPGYSDLTHVVSFTFKQDILLVGPPQCCSTKIILDKGNEIRNKNYIIIY